MLLCKMRAPSVHIAHELCICRLQFRDREIQLSQTVALKMEDFHNYEQDSLHYNSLLGESTM